MNKNFLIGLALAAYGLWLGHEGVYYHAFLPYGLLGGWLMGDYGKT